MFNCNNQNRAQYLQRIMFSSVPKKYYKFFLCNLVVANPNKLLSMAMSPMPFTVGCSPETADQLSRPSVPTGPPGIICNSAISAVVGSLDLFFKIRIACLSVCWENFSVCFSEFNWLPKCLSQKFLQ